MNDQLLDSLKRVDPAASDALPLEPPPEEQLARIVATPRAEVSRPSRLRPRRLLPVAALGAAAVAVLVAVLPTTSDQASPEAVRALESVAGIAAAQATPSPLAGFAYSRLDTASLTTFGDDPPYSYMVPTTVEQWVAADGSGRVRSVEDGPTFPGPRDERRWRAAGSIELAGGRTSDKRFGPGELNNVTPGAENLAPTSDLPTDVDELADRLREAAEESSQVPRGIKTFELASAVLMQAGASPELRAALYEVVSNIDGVQLDRGVRDRLGRLGTAVSITSDYSGANRREKLIFDPETSQPLAHVSELLEPQHWIDGRIIGYTLVEASGRVGEVQDRPGAQR